MAPKARPTNAPVQHRSPPVTALRGVGPQLSAKLAKLGISTLTDLLFHLPTRYEDRTTVTPLGAVRAGAPALVAGEVLASQVHQGRRRMLIVMLGDGTGQLALRFFHFSNSQREALRTGVRLRCFGDVRRNGANLEMVHPEFHFLRAHEDESETADTTLTAIYPLTEGISQGQLRKLVAEALDQVSRAKLLTELLPDECIEALQFPELLEAIEFVHQPPSDASLAQLLEGEHPCRLRLALEELIAQYLSLRVLRTTIQSQPAPAFDVAGTLQQTLLEQLPFPLTAAQARVVEELSDDLASTRPMYRLVQGDVGSGKTVVAAIAALRVIEGGAQVAVMAPTELLAEQHLENFKAWLHPLGLTVAWLSGRVTGRARTSTLESLASGDVALIVGTQALFQDPVEFQSLGLVIIDEQHRFGVDQRLALREKGVTAAHRPHQLIMTATPIPRTLAMTAYADLDVSVIDELPPGRQPIETIALAASRRPDVVERVHNACRNGQQAYWVCPLIEESDVIRSQAALEVSAALEEALPDVRVGLVHGRLKSAEKEAVMAQFKAAKLDLLVATTVIEVGVDVPNASLMIIENAERLGLSQLHQLRGRVGRGARKSHCVLLYEPPLSRMGKARIGAMRDTTDGFEIAQRDLELRGPGEVLGTRQTGLMQLKVADIIRDRDLLPEVNRIGEQLLEHEPERVEQLLERWLGTAVQYGEV